MDIDDSADKIRRNLLVFSAAILGTLFLQPKLAKNGQVLGFIDTKDIDPFRMWCVLTAVLSYLTYRYWVSDARREAWKKWDKEAHMSAQFVLMSRLRAGVRRHYTGNGTHPMFVNADAWPEASNQRVKSVRVSLVKVNVFHREGSGTLTVEFDEAPSIEKTYRYNLARPAAFLIFASAAVGASWRQGAAAEVFLPLALAGAAGILCVLEVAVRWPWVFVRLW